MTIQKLWLSGQDSWSGGQLSSSEVSLIQNFAYASNASAQLIDGDWEIMVTQPKQQSFAS